MMQITYYKYIQNPLGGTTQTNLQKEAIERIYVDKLNKIMLREAGKIKYTCYIDEKHDIYTIHIKIPSEVVPKFYYDTIIEFYTDDNTIRTDKLLTNYFCRFYSNDPAFVFTYAHAFIDKDLFIKELLPKMSKLAIKNKADIKNPNNITGYVKSLYFAYLVIKNYGLFNKTLFKTGALKYDKNKILNETEHADKKIAERQEAGEKLEKDKRKAKADTTNLRTQSHLSTKTTPTSTRMVNTAKTNFVKTIKNTVNTIKKK
jgi:hypothetical protein